MESLSAWRLLVTAVVDSQRRCFSGIHADRAGSGHESLGRDWRNRSGSGVWRRLRRSELTRKASVWNSAFRPEATFNLYYPDGVQRDRERARKAMSVISAHPVWYAGVMLRRMAGVLKFAGTPARYYGSSGVNVTSSKCLPETMQGGLLSALVTAVGMVQKACSVTPLCRLMILELESR